MRLALLSDIHGNLPALEAVLEDVARRGVDQVVNLGDSLSGPLYPAETARFLMVQPWVQIAGNHERQLLAFDPERGGASDRYALSTLGPEPLAWIARLPGTAVVVEEVFLCHGTPESDCEGFLETVEPSGARQATDAEVTLRAAAAAGSGATVVACGHTHVPRVASVSGGPLVVNPGSVGLPAYEEDVPWPHRMETGSPHASYAVLERRRSGWAVAHFRVPYGHASAAALARERGRDDWGMWLESGRARPPGSRPG